MRHALVVGLLFLSALAEARPTDVAGGDLWKYDAGDTVESYDTARFRVFFTRAGRHAVPLADANTNGTPDHVEEVGQLYEDVLSFYLGRGYQQPLSDAALVPNGGDFRFDVYLLDFAKAADGAFTRQACDQHRCTGYMVQENDFVGYAYPSATIGNRVLCSHEFFHAVQAAYNADQNTVLAEGTAVWATEQFDSTLTDFEGFVGNYLSKPDRSIDRPGAGPVDAFSYGSAIFFQFLSEKLDVDVIRKLYEDCAPGAHGVAEPTWLAALVALVEREYATTFASLFTDFASWNLFTLTRADPSRAYARGNGYPYVATSMGNLPYEDPLLRVFYASTQILRFAPGGRTQLAVEVLPADGMGMDTLADLHLVVAPVTSNKIGTLTPRAATEPSMPVELGTADEVFVELVNTATAGDSTRGIVCIGDPSEVAACKAKHTTTTTPMTPPVEDSGCALTMRPRGGTPFVLLLIGLLLLLRRAATG